MCGSSSGVQTRIKAVAPYAMYIHVHCNAHCLNLCLVDCVKVVYSGVNFFPLFKIYILLYLPQNAM